MSFNCDWCQESWPCDKTGSPVGTYMHVVGDGHVICNTCCGVWEDARSKAVEVAFERVRAERKREQITSAERALAAVEALMLERAT
jgi:hypothetical protein